jgi:hypothetical protein
LTLNPSHHPVPEILETPRFILRRQHPSDNALDYEAVMDSSALLHEWSHSNWPTEDFTLSDNAEDLAGHIEDFENNLAYGFSIFTPCQTRLLGSLYLEPVAPFIDDYQVNPAVLTQLKDFDVRVEYWLRRGTTERFEIDFLNTIIGWLKDDWWFANPVFGARRDMALRRTRYHQVGLIPAAVLTSHDGTRQFHFYARPFANASNPT